ncbi:MarR family winged helix-turn-helix transcriptional regulator [Amycolatopsis silviterrae]|uniref:MarR family winged helix-turn-helix transcriptional regulator n=1 Tax=Amycolatopsis silviterrae TaxID=1656914 RepID=A0ABW5HHP9_9PSEU
MDEIPRRLKEKPSWLLTQLTVHARRLVSEGFAEAGARGYHYRILAALDEFGPSSQADLGRRCRVDRSDVVAAVNQLTDLGYADRTPDPAHGRRNIVHLTKPGARQLRRMDKILDGVQDELLGDLSAEERETLVRLLGRVLTDHERS